MIKYNKNLHTIYFYKAEITNTAIKHKYKYNNNIPASSIIYAAKMCVLFGKRYKNIWRIVKLLLNAM